MKKAIAAILSAVMAVTLGATALGCAGTAGKDGINGVNGIDGIDGVDGVDGDPGQNGASAYEQFVASHPDYNKGEDEWLNDLAAGKLADNHEYSIVSFGRNLSGTLTDGTAESNGSTLSFESAVVKLNSDIIMPIAEDAEWEISIGGVLANGGASAELLASLDKSVNGRVYFGVYADSNIAYMGVNMGGVYFNYCWTVPGATIKSAHDYVIRYKDGTYYLSVDGGSFDRFTKLNQNQAGSVTIGDPKLASAELNAKIRAVSGQDYFAWTSIGADTQKVSCKLNYLDVKTSSIYTYENLSHHPLYGKTIYHLGSSISYGANNGGISFAEQIRDLTGSKMKKETSSGTTLAGPDGTSYVKRFDNTLKSNLATDKPEFLVLQLSTNDFAQNKTVGAVTGSSVTTGFDTNTICGAIEYVISECQKQGTKVLIYTCIIKDSWGARDKYGDFVDAQLKLIESKWNVIVVDLFNAEKINTLSWMSDDIHPTGHEYANHFTPAMINAMVEKLS